MDGLQDSLDDLRHPPSGPKRRSSRACDQCRRSKGKCDRAGIEDPCESCILGGLDCTTIGPNLKRGPQKGYLRAVEAQLHSVEAVLGVILSIPDPAVREQIRTLYSDPYAEAVLNRVEGGSFGPERCVVDDPNSILPLLDDIYTSEEKETANPFVVGANNQWQQYVLAKHYNKNSSNEVSNRIRSYQPQGIGDILQPQASGSVRQRDYFDELLEQQYSTHDPTTPSSIPNANRYPPDEYNFWFSVDE